MKEVNCRISKVSLQSEDTLFIDIQANEQFSLDDYNELKKAALQLGKGERLYNIINVGELTLPDREAREVSSSYEGSYYKKADAFIIDTLAQKIIANFMLRVNRPVVPTKFFSSIEAAENWINNLKTKLVPQEV